MKINSWMKGLYDDLFINNDKNTKLLAQLIVEDRKYSVPPWFIPYIGEEAFLSIILNFENIMIKYH